MSWPDPGWRMLNAVDFIGMQKLMVRVGVNPLYTERHVLEGYGLTLYCQLMWGYVDGPALHVRYQEAGSTLYLECQEEGADKKRELTYVGPYVAYWAEGSAP